MGEWMEYVTCRSHKPTDATGVPVSIDVIDATVVTSETSAPLSVTLTVSLALTGHLIYQASTVIATFRLRIY
jgi:hypothetical protein